MEAVRGLHLDRLEKRIQASEEIRVRWKILRQESATASNILVSSK